MAKLHYFIRSQYAELFKTSNIILTFANYDP